MQLTRLTLLRETQEMLRENLTGEEMMLELILEELLSRNNGELEMLETTLTRQRRESKIIRMILDPELDTVIRRKHHPSRLLQSQLTRLRLLELLLRLLLRLLELLLELLDLLELNIA